MTLPRIATRKIIHISMLVFPFLLPALTRFEAAGCAALALVFNRFVLPSIGVDIRRGHASTTGADANSGLRVQPRVASSGDAWTGIVVYPLLVLALVVFYGHLMHVVAAAWAIMALGHGVAGLVGERLPSPRLPFNPAKTWSGFSAFVLAGMVGADVLARWVNPSLPGTKVLIVSGAAGLIGALVESLPIRLDDDILVPLVCGGFMYCAYLMDRSALASNWPYLGRRIVLAVGINLLFALLALALKVVSGAGGLAGFLVGVAVYLGYGYKSFLILLAFVVLGSSATRLGYARKAQRGIAERRGGARGWREALANGLAGAFFSILVITTHCEAAFLVALVASFAEAAGDTVSSEIGQWLSHRAYLITTLRPVPAGENGGITMVGTGAGLAASAAVALLGYGLGLCALSGAAIALGAAVAGNVLDSLLGATVELRGLVTNEIVNFAGTSFAGGLALALMPHA